MLCIVILLLSLEVVPRLTLGLGQGAGVESEAVVMPRREVRGGIEPETDHALVNVIHPGSPLGRKRRKNQARREMVGGESQSVDIVCIHVHAGFILSVGWAKLVITKVRGARSTVNSDY